MFLQQLNKLKNVDTLSKIIFFNFLYLQHEKNIQFSRTDIENILMSSDLLGWFLLDNNKNITGYMVGTVRVLDDSRRVYFMNYFYVIEEIRNRGYGTLMTLNAFKYCKEHNISHIMLLTKKNDGFFKKFGFSNDILIHVDNENYEIITATNGI